MTAALRVLVIEDNTDQADALQGLLAEWGHDIRVDGNGSQALELVKSFQPHVILMDLGLPARHGYLVARDIRGALPDPGPLLVAVTGWGHFADKAQSSAEGFAHHLVKPIEPAHLKGLLDKHAAGLGAVR